MSRTTGYAQNAGQQKRTSGNILKSCSCLLEQGCKSLSRRTCTKPWRWRLAEHCHCAADGNGIYWLIFFGYFGPLHIPRGGPVPPSCFFFCCPIKTGFVCGLRGPAVDPFRVPGASHLFLKKGFPCKFLPLSIERIFCTCTSASSNYWPSCFFNIPQISS
jgi:hypothetical protein